ncbi:MAG TPA: hypothetical protein VD994_15040, partial [Prosthecobacter sp.]|nr:hypothetical protein [Prosthecobacter sp.]
MIAHVLRLAAGLLLLNQTLGAAANSTVQITTTEDRRVTVTWDAGADVQGVLELNPAGNSLIHRLALRRSGTQAVIATDLSPIFSTTTGTREQPPNRPPDMSIWNTFFDNPGKRPHQTHRSTFTASSVRVEDQQKGRASVIFGGLT